MKKKILAFTLALALALTLAACGGGNGSGNGGGSQDGGAAAPSGDVPAAGPAASAEVSGDNMTISLFAGSLPENTPTGGALAVMAEYINAYSNGTIQAEAFYDTALGDATSMVQGLQQGTVDGCDAPLSVLYTNGFPDICQYIDNVNLFYSPLPICISTNLFESLSAEDQQLLLDAAVQAAKAARDNNDATAERMESDLTEQGMTIIAEDEVDNAAFRDAVQSCYEEMESYVGSDWLAKIKSEVGLS